MKKDSFSNQEASLKSPSIFPQEQDSLQPIPFKYTVFLICAKHWPEVGGVGYKLRCFLGIASSWVSPTLWRDGRMGMAGSRLPICIVPGQLTQGPRGISLLSSGHGSLQVIKGPHGCQCAYANSTGLTSINWKSNRSSVFANRHVQTPSFLCSNL